MNDPTFSFDDVDGLQRKPDIEGKTGTVVDFPGDRWIRVLAASDNNPRWKPRMKIVSEGTRRLSNAQASNKRYREFIVPHIAEGLGVDWGGWKSAGVDIPYSAEAFKALLMTADDVYAAVLAVMHDDTKFRGDRIQVVADEGKG